MQSSTNLLRAARAALDEGDRRRAVGAIFEDLRDGPPSGERWLESQQLASEAGEILLALEAGRRFAATQPMTIDRFLHYLGLLVSYGREEQAKAELDRLPASEQDRLGILHFRGSMAASQGDSDAAEEYFRRAIATNRFATGSWNELSSLKTFTPGDPDIAAMQALLPELDAAPPLYRAQIHYALGKAFTDIGEDERGFDHYAIGAALRGETETYDPDAVEADVDAVIRDFDAKGLASLTPSRFKGQRAIYVGGLPRSGTTLVESLLVAHSKVVDGGELLLAMRALAPTVDLTLAGGLAYQDRWPGGDPWGEIAADYHDMLAMRFPEPGLVVDKTLGRGPLIGFNLHMMPDVRPIFVQRDPGDVALSAYRTFFSSSVPWSWSLEHIAHWMRQVERMLAHWDALFPGRILTVPYEGLVADPEHWIPRILNHVGLDDEPQVRNFHRNRRAINTASAGQVRTGIHQESVGGGKRYARFLEPFYAAYHRGDGQKAMRG